MIRSKHASSVCYRIKFRESCKILTKGFNKDFLPGSLTGVKSIYGVLHWTTRCRLLLDHFWSIHLSPVLMTVASFFPWSTFGLLLDHFWSTVPDQVRTLSQVGTSSYMAYAMLELTQGVPMWLKMFLLGPVVGEYSSLCSFTFLLINSSCICT